MLALAVVRLGSETVSWRIARSAPGVASGIRTGAALPSTRTHRATERQNEPTTSPIRGRHRGLRRYTFVHARYSACSCSRDRHPALSESRSLTRAVSLPRLTRHPASRRSRLPARGIPHHPRSDRGGTPLDAKTHGRAALWAWLNMNVKLLGITRSAILVIVPDLVSEFPGLREANHNRFCRRALKYIVNLVVIGIRAGKNYLELRVIGCFASPLQSATLLRMSRERGVIRIWYCNNGTDRFAISRVGSHVYLAIRGRYC